MRSSRWAVLLVLFLTLGLPLLAVTWRWWDVRAGAVELHARMPDAGGWAPANILVAAGEDLHLKLTSDDVLHGFAIGQSTLPEIDLYPGKTVETILRFDQPGKYTYYCTRWCGADHWRMRGTIEVTSEVAPQPVAQQKPLYMTLGLDIDAAHPATSLPEQRPSAIRGAALAIQLPEKYLSLEYFKEYSPEQVWHDLRGGPVTRGLDDQQVWDLVALVWQSNASPEAAEDARQTYARDCAACHGETGAGDGVFAQVSGSHAADPDLHSLQAPADFTDATQMLGASPALLQGKIVRGGMGAGMPYWDQSSRMSKFGRW